MCDRLNEEDGYLLQEKAIIAEVRVAAEIPLTNWNAQARHALMGNLGIQYTHAGTRRLCVEAIDAGRPSYPSAFMVLPAWGATLALAVPAAGLGLTISPPADEIAVGMRRKETIYHLPARRRVLPCAVNKSHMTSSPTYGM